MKGLRPARSRYSAWPSRYTTHPAYPPLLTRLGGHLWHKAVNSAGFLKSRQQCLTSFLQAALTIDADVEEPRGPLCTVDGPERDLCNLSC